MDVEEIALVIITVFGGVVGAIQLNRWLMEPSIFRAEIQVNAPLERVWEVIADPSKWYHWMFGHWRYIDPPQHDPDIVQAVPVGGAMGGGHKTIDKFIPLKAIAIGDSEFILVKLEEEKTIIIYTLTIEYSSLLDALSFRAEKLTGWNLPNSRIEALKEYVTGIYHSQCSGGSA